MHSLSTTTLSSKGQVVIPEEIRQKMGFRAGDQFVVIAEGSVIILKTITTPSMKEFDSLITKAKQSAKLAGLKKQTVKDAIKKAREK